MATETSQPPELKLFTLWPFTEEVRHPLLCKGGLRCQVGRGLELGWFEAGGLVRRLCEVVQAGNGREPWEV